MKPLLCSLRALATCSAYAETPAAVPVPPPPATAPAPPAVEAPAAVPAPSAKANQAARAATIRSKRAEAAADAVAGQPAADKTLQLVEMDTILPRTTKTGRTLVIQTSDPDPSAIANAEEDLSVMSLILRKATGGARTEDRRFPLGLEVDSTVFGSSSGARNIYLEGYGALFLLSVRFPLIAPADKADEKAPKENVSDNWATARDELLSAGSEAHIRLQSTLDQVWVGGNRPPAEAYDSGKVEELKTTLLQALKEAPHIRALKPSDYITVVIQGADAQHPEKVSTRAAGTARTRISMRRGETVMTVRVKKPDVDEFDAGKLDLDAFRKKAVFQTYFRRPDSSVRTAGFTSPAP